MKQPKNCALQVRFALTRIKFTKSRFERDYGGDKVTTYETMSSPNAWPLPGGMGRFPFNTSPVTTVVGGGAIAFETASLSLRPRASR